MQRKNQRPGESSSAGTLCFWGRLRNPDPANFPGRETLYLGFVLLEPAGDIEHLGDVMAWTAADAVRLFGDTHENGINV